MPSNEKACPINVVLLCTQAVMQIPQSLAQLIEQPSGAQNGLAWFVGFVNTVHKYSILAETPVIKRFSPALSFDVKSQRAMLNWHFAIYNTLVRGRKSSGEVRRKRRCRQPGSLLSRELAAGRFGTHLVFR